MVGRKFKICTLSKQHSCFRFFHSFCKSEQSLYPEILHSKLKCTLCPSQEISHSSFCESYTLINAYTISFSPPLGKLLPFPFSVFAVLN